MFHTIVRVLIHASVHAPWSSRPHVKRSVHVKNCGQCKQRTQEIGDIEARRTWVSDGLEKHMTLARMCLTPRQVVGQITQQCYFEVGNVGGL
jgi:hypothetical protein